MFWLDGDEKIQKPDQIRAMLQQAHGQAFQFWIISPLWTGGFHNMYQPRIFPAVPGVRFECPVFERLDWSLRRMGVPIQQTGFDPVLHATGYADKKLLEFKNKRNRRIMKRYLSTHKTPGVQREHIQTQYKRLTGKTA
jgi:hypothetical protein